MTRRARPLALLAAALAVAVAGGCEAKGPDLAEALAPVRGHAADASGSAADIDALLAAARGRPVSVSFAYVGCSSGRAPRMERLRSAESGVAAADGSVLHIVLDAVDAPNRYPDVVRDLIGAEPDKLDPNTVRVLFVDKGELWPKEPSAAVEGVMRAVGLRYGRDRFVETVSGIGLFDRQGRFAGIRY